MTARDPAGRFGTADEARTVTVRVRVTPTEAATLRAEARAAGVSLSEWLRGGRR